MWNLFLSTAGCFVFTRGYGLVTVGKERPGAVPSIRATDSPRTPSADSGTRDLFGGVSGCSAFSIDP
jgi:hypothetical protein